MPLAAPSNTNEPILSRVPASILLNAMPESILLNEIEDGGSAWLDQEGRIPVWPLVTVSREAGFSAYLTPPLPVVLPREVLRTLLGRPPGEHVPELRSGDAGAIRG